MGVVTTKAGERGRVDVSRGTYAGGGLPRSTAELAVVEERGQLSTEPPATEPAYTAPLVDVVVGGVGASCKAITASDANRIAEKEDLREAEDMAAKASAAQ